MSNKRGERQDAAKPVRQLERRAGRPHGVGGVQSIAGTAGRPEPGGEPGGHSKRANDQSFQREPGESGQGSNYSPDTLFPFPLARLIT